MSHTSSLLYFFFLTLVSLLKLGIASTLLGCPDSCGNITIPFPFGTIKGCYRPGFDLNCDETTNPPKLFLGKSGIQVLNFNLSTGEARALKYMSFFCFGGHEGIRHNATSSIDLRDRPAYLFSAKRNKFTVIGCSSLGYIVGEPSNGYQSGCLSFCSKGDWSSKTSGSCDGLGCCQISIPVGLDYYQVQWGHRYYNNALNFSYQCNYAALLEENMYQFEGHNLTNKGDIQVPFVLDWAIRDSGVCTDPRGANVAPAACLSKNSTCYNTTNGEGYLCNCTQGYEGNPYIPDGCRDINECEHEDIYNCLGSCINTEGDYRCTCPKGTQGDGKANDCRENIPYPARLALVSTIGVAILGALCFLLDAYRQKRKYTKEKFAHLKYYEMMASSVRVFSKKEIEMATNNFDENRVIGTGGHGKVYRGVLENNNQLAIKKSKDVEEIKREEFVKEIVLLSQINHKNIVRILGCCLEVKIPVLVYEFVPNGSLFDLLHGKNNNRSISLATRIKIALGSAEALDYLHNSISRSILHGDVKSANILLDNNNTAKVSDFGASNLVPTDDAQFIKLVQGTRGYLDPECWCTQIITMSSDVYSFGVVLLELITRKKAIYTDETNEKKNLATSFASRVNKNKVNEILDKEIINNDEKVIEVLRQISELALWCLSGKGDDRPTMKQVVEKLLPLVQVNPLFEQSDLEDTESLLVESSLNTAPSTSALYSTEYYSVVDTENGTAR